MWRFTGIMQACSLPANVGVKDEYGILKKFVAV
jgi:hypothetical protein